MTAILKTGYVKVKEYRHGLVEGNMRAHGWKIKHQEWGSLSILTVIFMRVNGKMIELTDMEFIPMLRQRLNMRVIGKMICRMALGFNYMKMVINMKGCLKRASAMEKELMYSLMELFIKVNG